MLRVLILATVMTGTIQAADPEPRVAPAALSLTLKGDIDAEMAVTAGRLASLFYEGYPNLLKRFDNPKKPAARAITIVFKKNMRVPAYCTGSEISVSVDWLKKHPDDVALITHELTHSVQLYPPGAPGWLTEGIADYARKIYGPKEQKDWSLPARLTAKQSYKDSYRTSARFLEWLDGKYPGAVDDLHTKLQAREYSAEGVQKFTGKTLDELWAECVEELEKKK